MVIIRIDSHYIIGEQIDPDLDNVYSVVGPMFPYDRREHSQLYWSTDVRLGTTYEELI